MPAEIEIKFSVANVQELEEKLKSAGFREDTPSTHEMNVLYDLPSGEMRTRGEVLRLRNYGSAWTLTHKSRGTVERHKVRTELETPVQNGEQMDGILRALGYLPSFIYEKFRSEWSDGKGKVVIDRTPIGDIAEIEGPAEWIDAVAHKLGVPEQQFITDSYAGLFMHWKRRSGSLAENMTFEDCGTNLPQVS